MRTRKKMDEEAHQLAPAGQVTQETVLLRQIRECLLDIRDILAPKPTKSEEPPPTEPDRIGDADCVSFCDEGDEARYV